MFYVNSVLVFVRWLAIAVVSVDVALVAYIFYRRVSHNRYYARKDAAQRRFAPVIASFFAGDLSTGRASELLTARNRAEREAIKVAVLAGAKGATGRAATDLLIALGYVQQWAEQAFGRRWARYRSSTGSKLISRSMRGRIRRLRVFAVRRAVAVGNLGRLSPEWAAMFMKQALLDPSPQVARLGVAALGRSSVPDGVGLLLGELHRAVVGLSEVPIRSIKTALVRYPIAELEHFTEWMDHANPRFRFLAVDAIREICRKGESDAPANFPPRLRQWFLQKAVCDPAADVRARSAAVIGWFRDQPAAAQLRRLLQDDDEFVRLHAVRACADPYYAALLEDILRLVTDRRWRVREAAVKTLAALPVVGRQALQKLFLDTSDRYASEQIADELQRSGLVLEIVPLLASASENLQAKELCTKMVRLGMDALLIEGLVEPSPAEVRTRLFEVLTRSGSPQLFTVVERIAGSETDPLHQQAQSWLRAHQSGAALAEGA